MNPIALHEPSLNMAHKSTPFPDMRGRVVVMTAMPPDFKLLGNVFGFKADSEKRLFCSRVFTESEQYPEVVLCGDFLGASLAVVLLEILAARGARDFLFCGPCGSLEESMELGSIFLPESALADDGTSKHYAVGPYSGPHMEYNLVMQAILNTRRQQFFKGGIVSTDGVFRETQTLIDYFLQNNCRAVDMETAALFAAARYLKVKLCSINVISDVFANGAWTNGLGGSEFKRGRAEAIEVIKEMVVWMQKKTISA